MIKVKFNNNKNPTKLSVFDFDGTLFKSPDKPKGYKGNWWISKESLNEPNVPQVAPDQFWNLDVVEKAKQEISNPNNLVILMTGRVGKFFHERIVELISQKNLNFKHVWCNEFGGDTGKFKIGKIQELLKKHPSIKKIEMWEDEPEKVELYTSEFGDSVKINKIGKEELSEAPHTDISDLPDDFVDGLPQQASDILKRDGVLDFVSEKFKTPGKEFYVDLGDKTYIVNRFGDVKRADVKDPSISTLPSEWIEAYIERMKL